MKNKRGISLIVLIITIIVIIILAAAVILVINTNNPISSAKEATFKEDIITFQDDLAMSVAKDYTNTQGNRNTKINATSLEDIQKYIPSFTKKYEGKFIIKDDGLVGTVKLADDEKKWLDSMNTDYQISEEEAFFEWGSNVEGEEGYNTITGYKTENWGGITVLNIPSRCKKIVLENVNWQSPSNRTQEDGIVKVNLPDTIEEIGRCAFDNFVHLEEINIPSSVKVIGYFALNSCIKLKQITLPEGLTEIGEGAFRDCTNATGTLTIPASVTSIGDYAFQDCQNLTNIELTNGSSTPSSLVSIGVGAFANCYKLSGNIVLPDTTTTISERAFFNCYVLSSITIPISVVNVGSNAFDSCYDITINCKTASKPSTWNSNWNSYGFTVNWGYAG